MSDARWDLDSAVAAIDAAGGSGEFAYEAEMLAAQQAEAWLRSAFADRDAKAALLDDAVKALEPFAKLAMPGREGLPDDRKYLVVDNTWLTLGDFRRATAIFTRLRDVPVHDTKGEA